MLQERNPKTGQWLFSSSQDLQQQQVVLLGQLCESMDGSDILKAHETVILKDFEQYLENWIRLLQEEGQ